MPRQRDEIPPKHQHTVYFFIALIAVGTFIYSSTREGADKPNVQKAFVAQTSPKFHLTKLNRDAVSRQKQKQGLRWGIVGLGRIAHDFTSA